MAGRIDLHVSWINQIVANTTDRKALINDLAAKLFPQPAFATAA
jgi:hypothetical protein